MNTCLPPAINPAAQRRHTLNLQPIAGFQFGGADQGDPAQPFDLLMAGALRDQQTGRCTLRWSEVNVITAPCDERPLNHGPSDVCHIAIQRMDARRCRIGDGVHQTEQVAQGHSMPGVHAHRQAMVAGANAHCAHLRSGAPFQVID